MKIYNVSLKDVGTLFFWVTEYHDEIFLTANFVDFVQNSFDIHVHVKLDFN